MNKFVFALALCGLLQIDLSAAQRTPSISYITQEQIKDIGGSVELQCSVQYASDYNVVWIKQGGDRFDSVFISNSASLVLKDSRFALRYDVSSSTYTLQIKDLQETDAGKYECQVILSVTNKIRASVDVQVRRPPIISDNSTQSIVASEGRSVQMECYAGGYPQPTITWRRENNAILPTGKELLTMMMILNLLLEQRRREQQVRIHLLLLPGGYFDDNSCLCSTIFVIRLLRWNGMFVDKVTHPVTTMIVITFYFIFRWKHLLWKHSKDHCCAQGGSWHLLLCGR